MLIYQYIKEWTHYDYIILSLIFSSTNLLAMYLYNICYY